MKLWEIWKKKIRLKSKGGLPSTLQYLTCFIALKLQTGCQVIAIIQPFYPMGGYANILFTYSWILMKTLQLKEISQKK